MKVVIRRNVGIFAIAVVRFISEFDRYHSNTQTTTHTCFDSYHDNARLQHDLFGRCTNKKSEK
jgi:hypothetical protein